MIDHFAGDDRTMRERMLAGDFYLADDPELEALMTRAAVLAERYRADFTRDYEAARKHLEELVGELGEGVFIRPPLYVDYGSNLRIGARSFANYGLVALDVAPIVIGEDVQIGPNVQLLTPTHPVEPGPRRDKLEAAKPIT
ncbi:MAG: sugar O-acetyltransferase, partial [Glycomyces artemisiae]|nr:sugar O-acetyltransferase [Glycomyces artemisiae]